MKKFVKCDICNTYAEARFIPYATRHPFRICDGYWTNPESWCDFCGNSICDTCKSNILNYLKVLVKKD